jgi:hypothetical protein
MPENQDEWDEMDRRVSYELWHRIRSLIQIEIERMQPPPKPEPAPEPEAAATPEPTEAEPTPEAKPPENIRLEKQSGAL